MSYRRMVICWLSAGIGFLYLLLPLYAQDKNPKNVAPPSSGDMPQGLNGIRTSYEEILKSLRETEFQSVKPSDESGALTLDGLRRGQLAWREKLKNLHVDFTYALDRKINIGADVQRQREGRLVAPNFTFSLGVAFKGDKRFNKYKISTGNKPVTYITAFNGDQSRSYEPFRALGQISAGRKEGIENNAAWYFDMISILSGPAAEKIKETELYVPKALEFADEYQVLPKLEKVDDFPCHVVSSGWDTLWIDHQHGFCLRRRVLFRRTGPNDPGCLDYITICKDFAEADKGIWLPKLCYRMDYTTQLEPEHFRGKLAAVNTVTVTNLQVNNVPDSLFEITFPPGTEVQDLVLNKAYYIPHGEEKLDKAIAQGRSIINGKVYRGAAPEGKRFPIIWLINFLVVMVLAIMVFLRHLRRSRSLYS